MENPDQTIDVPTEQYSESVPDFYDKPTVPVQIRSFSKKLYIDFPDWGRVDGESEADENNLPVNARGHMKTSQFCMDAMTIFRATVSYTTNFHREYMVHGIERKLGVCDDVYPPRDNSVSTLKHSGMPEDNIHCSLMAEFIQHIMPDIESDYWQGYVDGSGEDKTEVAYKVFKRNWDGNADLLLHVGGWFAQKGEVVSARSNAFFPIPQWGTTSGGNYVNTISNVESGMCPECGEPLSDTQTCYSSSNRTRVANKYKCDPENGGCGYKFKGITTG